MAMARTPVYWTNKKMPAILAGGVSVVSLPGSSWLWRSLSRLSRFSSALKLLKNRQAAQAIVKSVVY